MSSIIIIIDCALKNYINILHDKDQKNQIINNKCIINVTNNISIIQPKKYNFIYILHIARFRNRNELTYKYGRTSDVFKRFFGYPKMSTILYLCSVIDCKFVENEIKKIFTRKYKHEDKYGHEYFSGDVNGMINDINELIKTKNQLVDNDIMGSIEKKYKKHLYFNISDYM